MAVVLGLVVLAVVVAATLHHGAAPNSAAAPSSAVAPTTGAAPGSTARVHAPSTTAVGRAEAAQLVSQLDTLAVAAPDWSVRYRRVPDFGPAWADVDHNGCDTRNDILRRDLVDLAVRPGTHGCVVVAGLLHDPYTGTDIRFLKAHASEVQIDHVVPLAAAWSLGASRWTGAEREAYANDPTVLRAVSGSQNEAKGDELADRWRPPNRGDWCAYATQTVQIHAKYALAVTAPEKAALTDMLATCR